MQTASSLRERIRAIAGWAELSAGEIASVLSVPRATIGVFLTSDPEMRVMRLERRRRLEVETLERLRCVDRWQYQEVSLLAEELQVPQALLLRAMGQSGGDDRENFGSVAERGRRMAEKIKAIPGWEIKSNRVLAKVLRCNSKRIGYIFRSNPALAEERRLGRFLRREYLETLQGWEVMASRDIARRLQTKVPIVKDFFRLNPNLAGGRLIKKPAARRRQREMKDVHGWQTMRMREIALGMGITSASLREALRCDREMRELFRAQYQGWPRKWSARHIAAVQSEVSTALSSTIGYGVASCDDRGRLLEPGVLAGEESPRQNSARDRLLAVDGWQTMSNVQIGGQLGVTPARISEIFCYNPDLMARRRPNFQRKRRAALTERIMALPNWETQTALSVSQQTGITRNMIGVLMKCVVRLAGWRGRTVDNRWKNPIEDIQGIANWREKSSNQLASELRRSQREVYTALMENPELLQEWVYQPKPTKKHSVLYETIKRIPNWGRLSYAEIGALLGRRTQNIQRCIVSASFTAQYHSSRAALLI